MFSGVAAFDPYFPSPQPPIQSCLTSPITPKTAMGEGLMLPTFIPKIPRHAETTLYVYFSLIIKSLLLIPEMVNGL